jgi:hypothetical protein
MTADMTAITAAAAGLRGRASVQCEAPEPCCGVAAAVQVNACMRKAAVRVGTARTLPCLAAGPDGGAGCGAAGGEGLASRAGGCMGGTDRRVRPALGPVRGAGGGECGDWQVGAAQMAAGRMNLRSGGREAMASSPVGRWPVSLTRFSWLTLLHFIGRIPHPLVQMGVICLYKAQVTHIRRALAALQQQQQQTQQQQQQQPQQPQQGADGGGGELLGEGGGGEGLGAAAGEGAADKGGLESVQVATVDSFQASRGEASSRMDYTRAAACRAWTASRRVAARRGARRRARLETPVSQAVGLRVPPPGLGPCNAMRADAAGASPAAAECVA